MKTMTEPGKTSSAGSQGAPDAPKRADSTRHPGNASAPNGPPVSNASPKRPASGRTVIPAAIPAQAKRPTSGRIILPQTAGTEPRRAATGTVILPANASSSKRPVSGRIALPAAGGIMAEAAEVQAQRARAKTTKSIRLPSLVSSGKDAMPERTSVQATQHWSCHSCGKTLSAERVAQGAGTLENGVLTCSECRRREQQRKASDRNKKLGFVAGIAILGVAAIVSLSSFLFVLFLFAQGAIFVGALGFTLTGRTRLVLAAAGIIIAVCSMVAIRELKSRSETRKESAGLSEKALEIQDLLKKDRIADAQNRLSALNAVARDRTGHFISPEAEKSMTEATKLIDDWFRSNYGELSPQERDVLARLMTLYPDKPGATVRRLNAVKVQGILLKLTVVLQEEPKDLKVTEDVKDLPFNVFDLFPALMRLELQFVYAGAGGDLGVAGGVSMDRSQAEAQRQRQATDAALIISKEPLPALPIETKTRP